MGSRFGTPVLVAGLRGDADDVQDPALTGDELVEGNFASPTGGINDIWSSRRASATGTWEPSALVTELASTGNDEDPDLSERVGSRRGPSSQAMAPATACGCTCREARGARPALRCRPNPESELGPTLQDRAPSLDAAQLQMVFGSQRGTATVPHL